MGPNGVRLVSVVSPDNSAPSASPGDVYDDERPRKCWYLPPTSVPGKVLAGMNIARPSLHRMTSALLAHSEGPTPAGFDAATMIGR